MNNFLPLIAITMGDPAGIGPEVLLKFAASEIHKPNAPYQVIAVGSRQIFEETAEKLGIPLKFNFMEDADRDRLSSTCLNIIDLANAGQDGISLGTVSKKSGKVSVECLLKAVDLAVSGKVDAITTAPISKEAINLAEFPYPGHTEFLAEYTNTQDFAMMMIGGKIKVVLVTTHIPLSAVTKEIKKERVERTIRLTHRSLSFLEGKQPSIAVAALNPHAGDGGVIGKEDTEEIAPAVEECSKDGIRVTGPYPADSLFAKVKQGRFDAVVVMYHDQGLIPVKMEGFGRGVNVTLGLPIIRTSVDHGVAFDIAGKGIADPSSMKAAVHYAAKMAMKKNMSDG